MEIRIDCEMTDQFNKIDLVQGVPKKSQPSKSYGFWLKKCSIWLENTLGSVSDFLGQVLVLPHRTFVKLAIRIIEIFDDLMILLGTKQSRQSPENLRQQTPNTLLLIKIEHFAMQDAQVFLESETCPKKLFSSRKWETFQRVD